MVWIITAVQWLHITAGVLWIGSAVGLDLVMWPTLLRLPAEQARPLHQAILRAITPFSGAAGVVTILLGLARGTLLGPITSLEFLFGTAYGITWLVAIALTIVAIAVAATWHPRSADIVWDDAGLRPGAARRVYLQGAAELGCFALILVCMVLLPLGL